MLLSREIRLPGVHVIVNENKKRIWTGVSSDCTSAIRPKLSAINSYLNKTEGYASTPIDLIEDIEKEKRNIADNIYIFVYKINDVYKYTRDNNIDINEEDIKILLKAYVRKIVFKEYAIYGAEKWYTKNNEKLIKNKWIIESLIAKEYIKIYKSKDNTYEIVKLFDWEEVSISSLLLEEENNTIINKEEDVVVDDIEMLIKIESVLRGCTREELINKIISNQTREIYRITVKG